ncbi:19482_t:CDS:2 [Racocetra persica]|uniref:19482_t:CDS:1 n=1 Tax=Racocetra persica TaxID=160502 RepID=A0ACA9KW78_9GLOM|nr:19482_t:CDS:2 [Racocetra persica]
MPHTNFTEEIPFKEFTAIETLNLPEFGIFKTATLKWSNKTQTMALIRTENNTNNPQKFAADGNLRDYLVRNKISRKTKLKMAKGIAKGLEYLHKKGIVHENLMQRAIREYNVIGEKKSKRAKGTSSLLNKRSNYLTLLDLFILAINDLY